MDYSGGVREETQEHLDILSTNKLNTEEILHDLSKKVLKRLLVIDSILIVQVLMYSNMCSVQTCRDSGGGLQRPKGERAPARVERSGREESFYHGNLSKSVQ